MIGGFEKTSDAVIAYLQSQTFSQTPNYEFALQAYPEVGKTTGLMCFVLPVSKTFTVGTRKKHSRIWRVAIQPYKQNDADTKANKAVVDAGMMTLMDEIEEAIEELDSIEIDGERYPIGIVLNEPFGTTDILAYQRKSFMPVVFVEVLDQ